MLKLQFPHREVEHEAEALRRWDGDGAVRLLDVAPEHHALLLERAEPGTHAGGTGDPATRARCARRVAASPVGAGRRAVRDACATRRRVGRDHLVTRPDRAASMPRSVDAARSTASDLGPTVDRVGAAPPGPARRQRPARVRASRGSSSTRSRSSGERAVLRRADRAQRRARTLPRRGARTASTACPRSSASTGNARATGRSVRRWRGPPAATRRVRRPHEQVVRWLLERRTVRRRPGRGGRRRERDRHRLVAAHEVGGRCAGLVRSSTRWRSGSRSSSTSNSDRSSSRASELPRQKCVPKPNATWSFGVRSMSKVSGREARPRRGSPTGRAAAASGRPGSSCRASSTSRVAVRAMFLIGLTQRSISSTARGTSVRSPAAAPTGRGRRAAGTGRR